MISQAQINKAYALLGHYGQGDDVSAMDYEEIINLVTGTLTLSRTTKGRQAIILLSAIALREKPATEDPLMGIGGISAKDLLDVIWKREEELREVIEKI